MKLVVDTHTHTVSSGHAYSTVVENAREAGLNGIEAFVVTDHGPSMEGAPTTLHFWNLKAIPESIYGVKVLKGAEANIIDYEGRVDLSDGILKRLDFVIASFHDITITPGTVEENTRALTGALKNPFVDAVAHPGNPTFQVDIDAVVRTASEYGKLIEINNHSFQVRKGCEPNCREFARACRKYGAGITCGSDAHVCFDVGRFDMVQRLLEEEGIPEELVICTALERFEGYMKARKRYKTSQET